MKLRFQITKEKEIRFISHLEYVRTIGRAIRRAKLPAAYSQGFNPHMKYSLASALGVGVVSYAEFVELELTEPMNPLEAAKAFKKALPRGIRVLAVDAVETNAPALMSGKNLTVRMRCFLKSRLRKRKKRSNGLMSSFTFLKSALYRGRRKRNYISTAALPITAA